MERKRLDKEPEAETPLPHVRRASSMPASTSPPAQGRTREREFPIRRQDEIGNIPRGPAPVSRCTCRQGCEMCSSAMALPWRWPASRCSSATRFRSRKAPHLPASACRGGPERLVRRPWTRLVRFADLRNGNLVQVHPTGEFFRAVIAGSCAGLFHLHRSLPVSHRVQCGAPACRARAQRERGALPRARAVLLRRVLGNRRRASLHAAGIFRTADGRAGTRSRDRQDPLGDPVRRARRRGLAQAPGHARRAPAIPGFRARPPDCGRRHALRLRFRHPGVR